MAYTPPAWNAVDFSGTGEVVYGPQWDRVDFITPPAALGQGEAAAPAGPSAASAKSQDATAAGAQLAGTGAVATAGIPPIAAALGVISAGLTIYNMIQSGRQRSKMAAAARAAEADRQRAINEARLAAYASQSEELQRSAAQERLQTFQEEERARHNDFVQRSNEFLRNGASVAHFAQQPKEFQNRFADQFGPELLQFTRRPQFQSRLNLIESVAGRIPKARY